MAATGTKVDEENCEPQILLRRLCKGLRANNGNLPKTSRSGSFGAETQSPRGIRDGLRIAPSFESTLRSASPRSRVRFHSEGRRAKAFTDSVPAGAFTLAKPR